MRSRTDPPVWDRAAGASVRRSPPPILRPASRRALWRRMLHLREATVERIGTLTGVATPRLRSFRSELESSDLPDRLIARGAGLSFVRELPHGVALYLLVRALAPLRVLETGVRPGYSTAWILSALEANGRGELTSLGPGGANGRAPGVANVFVGQFVPPPLRTRWTLVLGNTEDRLREILSASPEIDLFFYDNGPDPIRARFELKAAWSALSPHGILLAHHAEATPSWREFCAGQGLPPQIVDPGPPALGGLSVDRGRALGR
ncbi:MAG: class I SAM-dependent methyltransferase [Thermoplasmata archaeon]